MFGGFPRLSKTSNPAINPPTLKLPTTLRATLDRSAGHGGRAKHWLHNHEVTITGSWW
jgi:hypothetical protein